MFKLSKVEICLIAAVGSALALTSVAHAQQKEKFAQAQKENSDALKQYTWKSRTEIKVKGESKNVKLEQVSHDLDGKQQKTDIGGAPQEQPSQEASGRQRGGRRGGGKLKAKVVENKKAEFAELLKGLGQLVASYAHLPPEKMQAFAANATIGPGEGEMADALMIQGTDVQVPGDTMGIWIDPKTYMMRQIDIQSSFEDNPVHFTGEFRAVTDGPTYPARLVLTYPDKEVELTIENLEHARAGS